VSVPRPAWHFRHFEGPGGTASGSRRAIRLSC